MPITSLQKTVERTLKKVRERQAIGGVDYVGIPTGFPKLDEATGGLRNRGVYILAGRPGMGKTACAFTMARNISKLGNKVLYATFEMSAEMLSIRFLAGLTGIPALDIERGRLTNEQLLRVEKVQEEIKSLPFGLLDSTVTSQQLLEQATKVKAENGLDLLIVDYITLLNDPNKAGQTDRVTEISRMMAVTARDLDIPVLGLSQLNREVEKREGSVPTLSDLRDSGAVEQDADGVFFCHRPHYYAMLNEGAKAVPIERDARILLAKNRHGPVGRFNVVFIPDRMVWMVEDHKPTDPPNTNMGKLTASESK